MLCHLKRMIWTVGVFLVLAPISVQAIEEPVKEVRTIKDLPRTATTVQEWLSQSPAPDAPTPIQVTGVRLNQTTQGIEVILQTADGQALQSTTREEGNTFVAEIPNAILALPDGKEFRADNPSEGIINVTVIQIADSTIRVNVTGKDAVPIANITPASSGLVLSLTPDTEPEEEITVTGEQQRGYQVPNSSTATRTDTLIRDIPGSIQVIPRQVLEDQQVTRLQEAVRNVSGVSEGDGFGGAFDRFVIRGFPQFNTLRNDFRIGESGLRDFANIEQVEVLKGPASVISGNVEPGGIVNLVTKKPLSEPFYQFNLQVGNYSLVRPSIDISGPLNSEKTVLYRLNAAYETADSFREPTDQKIERLFIAPVLTWKISEDTSLTFDLEYLKFKQPFDRGLVAIGNGVADIPINRFLGEPGDFYELEEIGVGYELGHRFNQSLSLRHAFRFLQSDTFDYKTQVEGLDEQTGELQRAFDSNDDIKRIYATQTELTARFTTGSVKHTLLFGFDLSQETNEGTNSPVPPEFNFPINIFNPVYEVLPRADLSQLLLGQGRDGFARANLLGIFLQDQIALFDNLKLLLGGRFDAVDQKFEDRLSDTTSTQSDSAFSPRIGLVYQPIPSRVSASQTLLTARF